MKVEAYVEGRLCRPLQSRDDLQDDEEHAKSATEGQDEGTEGGFRTSLSDVGHQFSVEFVREDDGIWALLERIFNSCSISQIRHQPDTRQWLFRCATEVRTFLSHDENFHLTIKQVHRNRDTARIFQGHNRSHSTKGKNSPPFLYPLTRSRIKIEHVQTFLLKRLLKMMGIKIKPHALSSFESRLQRTHVPIFEGAEIKSLGAKVKHMSIINHARGKPLLVDLPS